MALRSLGGFLYKCISGALGLRSVECCPGSGGAPCSYSVDCTPLVIPACGGSASVLGGLVAPAGCSWNFVSNKAWLTADPPTSHLSSGAISCSAALNPGPGARTANLIIRFGTTGIVPINECGGMIAVSQDECLASCPSDGCVGCPDPITLNIPAGMQTCMLGPDTYVYAWGAQSFSLPRVSGCHWHGTNGFGFVHTVSINGSPPVPDFPTSWIADVDCGGGTWTASFSGTPNACGFPSIIGTKTAYDPSCPAGAYTSGLSVS